MLLELLIIYFLYAVTIIAVNYYVRLIRAKDTYTRSEIVNPLPGFSQMAKNLSEKYSGLSLIMVTAVFSFMGMILTYGISHWIGRSALIPVILMAVLPLLKKYYANSQVSEYDNYGDIVKNIFIRYNEIIVISYSLGASASIIYCWGALREIGFLWFLLNIIIISAGLTYLIQKPDSDKNSIV